MGSAASTAYTLGQEASGSSSIGAGLSGMASAAGGTARSRMSAALGFGKAAESGRQGALNARTNRTAATATRSEEHTSELQSLMCISYAVFCLQKKKQNE